MLPNPTPPIGVTVLANSQCPHCIQAVDHVTDWAIAERIPIAAIDLWRHPEAAEWIATEHSPTLLIQGANERLAIGMPTHQEFLRLVRE